MSSRSPPEPPDRSYGLQLRFSPSTDYQNSVSRSTTTHVLDCGHSSNTSLGLCQGSKIVPLSAVGRSVPLINQRDQMWTVMPHRSTILERDTILRGSLSGNRFGGCHGPSSICDVSAAGYVYMLLHVMVLS